MRYRVFEIESARVLPALDGIAVVPGDVVVVAVVRDVEAATEVMRALHADDVRRKIAAHRGKR